MLIFSRPAVNDLVRLRKFIAENNPEAAQRVAGALVESIHKLIEAPRIGRPVVDIPGEVRELVVGKYVVRYEVRKTVLYILRIWHGKENR